MTSRIALALVLVAMACQADDGASSDEDLVTERAVVADSHRLFSALDEFWTAEIRANYRFEYDAPDLLRYYRATVGNPTCGESTRLRRANNAYYCSRETGYQYVAFDLLWLSELRRNQAGAETTTFTLAHEWAHSVQFTWGLVGLQSHYESKSERELEADCLAGVSLGGNTLTGGFRFRARDVDEVLAAIRAVGGPTTKTKGHGTVEQRESAFLIGVTGGVKDCWSRYSSE